MAAKRVFTKTENQIEASELIKELRFITREYSDARSYLDQSALRSNDQQTQYWERVSSDLYNLITIAEDRLMQIVPIKRLS
jgi:hypothetical protein